MAEFADAERKILIQTARESIQNGLQSGRQLTLALDSFPEILQQERACFVTLHLNGSLRGCIGTLNAHQPLIMDVIKNSFNAAFRDPRFPPLSADEYHSISLDISILSKPQPMQFSSEQDLLRQLRPGIDGLILTDQGHRGTFLPSVWEQLPAPMIFLQHLKNKAGLPTNYWSDTLRVENYTTELIS